MENDEEDILTKSNVDVNSTLLGEGNHKVKAGDNGLSAGYLAKRGRGELIASIVFFAFAFILLAVSFYCLIDMLNDENTKALGFVIFILTIGWIVYLPGAFLNVVAICLCFAALKRTAPGKLKIVAKIFTILSVVLIVLYFAFAVFLLTVNQG